MDVAIAGSALGALVGALVMHVPSWRARVTPGARRGLRVSALLVVALTLGGLLHDRFAPKAKPATPPARLVPDHRG